MTNRAGCGKLETKIFKTPVRKASGRTDYAHTGCSFGLSEQEPRQLRFGEEIAASLGVTRNAVWKAIRKLEADGHRIDAVPKRGYALSADSDVLSAGSVSRYLTTDFPVRLDVRRAVTSTNTLLKAEAEQGAQEGLVLIAEAQTAGKGRLGRQFQSPAGTGVYFSFLLRPTCTAERSLFITTAAAVARVPGGRGRDGAASADQVGERRLSERQEGLRHFDRGRNRL